MAIAGSLVVTVSARTQDFEAGMRKTTATLKFTEQQAAQVAQAFGGLGQALSNMGNQAQGAAQKTTTLNRSMKETGGVMADIKGQLTGLIASFVAFSALKAGITSTVDAALKQERLVSILTAVTGSQQKASEAMAFARQEAERFGVEMNAATEGYGRLLGATKSTVLEGARTNEMYRNILATMSAFKVSAEDQNNIMRATNQILQQGAIQGDELKNEIGSRLPIMQKLVEASNGAFKTQLEFNKAMEDGKLKGEAASAIMYNLFQIMARDATKAGQAGQGAAAEFARFNNTLTALKETIGVGFLPALGEAARALNTFLQLGKDSAGVFGGNFTVVIREATSAVIGLTGYIVVLGKYMAALGAGVAFGADAWQAGWEDVKETARDVLDLQNKVRKGGFAAEPGGAGAGVGEGPALPVVPGGGKADEKAAKKTAAERESERIGERQKDLVNEIANAYDAANLVLEYGVELERTRMEQKLREAKFSKADLDTLMATYDATQRLLEQRKADEKLAQDRLQLSTQLQESLDKQLYTERELLQRKLTALGFSQEEAAVKLKMFDTETRLREETEKRTEAEKEAVEATKEHLATIQKLQDQLQPRIRRTRAEELQDTISEMAGETSDAFTLAQADIQRLDTLDLEENAEMWERWKNVAENSLQTVGDAITQFAFHGKFSFKDMMASIAEDLFRFATQTLMQSATKKGGWLEMGLDFGLKALGIVSGVSGGVGTTGATAGAITQTSVGGGGGDFGIGQNFSFAQRQHGGPVMPGKFYMVGERGPELFAPRTSGTIIPNGQGVSSPTVVNVHVSGVQDAQSFVQSRGAVSRAMMNALNQARGQM